MIPSPALFPRALALAAAVLAAVPARADEAPAGAEVKPVTPEEFAAESGQAKRYVFELAWPDGLIDAVGTHIAAADEAAYLQERKLDPAGIVLLYLTDQSPPLSAVAPEVNPLGRYGFKRVVFQHKDGGKPLAVAAEYHAAAGPKPARHVVLIRGRPNPLAIASGDPRPDVSARPANLRPGDLPPQVRYAFGPDEAMAAAAQLATAHLGSPPAPAGPLLGDQVSLLPGAWAALRDAGWTDPGGIFTNQIPTDDGKPVRLTGKLVSGAPDLARVEEKLRDLVAHGGGGAVHAATTAEMARWWPFEDFDYAEPLLFLETADHAHDLVLVFENGRLVAVDDLAGLPRLP